MTERVVTLTGAALLVLSAATCNHKVVVVPAVILVPIARWTLPLEATDDTPFCIAATGDPWLDPADVLPLRCVSVGSVRAWIRGQRLANE